MTFNAENLVEAGTALQTFGRHLQRIHPVPSVIGCQFPDEQAVLDSLLPGNNGIYVDIGAHSPTDCSNTLEFYRRGWRGLLIEPLPDCWPVMLIDRSDDYLFPGAASDQDGYAQLRVCRNISSLKPEWPNDSTESIPVRTETLKSILARYPAVEWSKTRFCSIDVEGSEREVLLGIDWATFHPDVLMIEYRNYVGVDTSAAWRQILEPWYREFFANQLNAVFVRK